MERNSSLLTVGFGIFDDVSEMLVVDMAEAIEDLGFEWLLEWPLPLDMGELSLETTVSFVGVCW